MVDLANINGIDRTLCTQIGILSSNTTTVFTEGKSMEHIKVKSEEWLHRVPLRRRNRLKDNGSLLNAFTLDSLNISNSISLLHLDVEEHEGEVLEGARETINKDRPIVITEGFNTWPSPQDGNDQRVLKIMTELNYTSASEIPEYCGIKKTGRNRIWWPDAETMVAAIAIVGKELSRQGIVPWIASDLPEL